MKRLEVLRQIDEIQKEHCKPCTALKSNKSACIKCPIGQQIKALGNQLLKGRLPYQDILDKGEYMTPKEILFLREMDIGWKEIAGSMGWSKSKLQSFMNEYKEAGDMTEKAQIEQMLKDGMKPKDIADTLKIKPQRVHNIKYNMKKEGEKVEPQKETIQKPAGEVVPKRQVDDLNEAYQKLEYQLLHKEKEWHEQAQEKDRLIASLKEDCATMTYTIQEMKKQLEQPANDFESQYEAMKAKHDKLLEYVMLQ